MEYFAEFRKTDGAVKTLFRRSSATQEVDVYKDGEWVVTKRRSLRGLEPLSAHEADVARRRMDRRAADG